uniref:J domain-containing protein n=1 Tax=Cucumis sativus TaxID=3659 RepID=A0A0A0M107_CUCSA
MDHTWRLRFGIPRFRSRRSERQTLPKPTSNFLADDFSDVFGGPPQTILFRQFSERFEGIDSTTSFYEEVFRSSELVSRPQKGGRSLPAFRIPVKEDRFYRDVFGSEDGRRSRDRSEPSSKEFTRSNSSSDFTRLRPVIGDDVAFPSSSSNHRPTNVPTQWNSYTTMFKEQEMPQFAPHLSPHMDNRYVEDEYDDRYKSSDHGFGQPVSSPETVILEPNSFRSIKICVDDYLEINSPSSPESSLCEDPVYYDGTYCNVLPEDDDDDEDAMSSYVIEITSINREEYREEVSIDEAIAWAKSKYQSASETDLSVRQQESEQSGEEEGRPVAFECSDQQSNGNGLSQTAETQQREVKVEEEKPQLNIDRELEGLDEKIKLWSAGKETNIRLLLSTLHYILWSSSGWSPISLTNLIGGTQVKKAYQKARLCLHPDKLQQRGATTLQKHVADKAFTILQEAWSVYISQDAFIN